MLPPAVRLPNHREGASVRAVKLLKASPRPPHLTQNTNSIRQTTPTNNLIFNLFAREQHQSNRSGTRSGSRSGTRSCTRSWYRIWYQISLKQPSQPRASDHRCEDCHSRFPATLPCRKLRCACSRGKPRKPACQHQWAHPILCNPACGLRPSAAVHIIMHP